MRSCAILVAALGACSFRHGAADDASVVPSDVIHDVTADVIYDSPPDVPQGNANGYDKTITVARGKVVDDVSGFPVWISLSNDADLIALAHDDHGDVYFTDVGGAPIPYEITAWDRPSGTLQAWIRAANLTPSTLNPNPNQFHLRFGGPAAPIASNGATVFDNGFAAVWHLESAATTVVDATGMTPGTLAGAITTAGGQLGTGLTFTGTTTAINFTNPITGTGSSTMSAWVYEAPTTGSTYSYSLIVVGTATGDEARWFYSRHGGHASSICAGLYNDDHIPSPADVLPTATWKKLDWVFEGTTRASHLYVDGNEVGSGATLNTANTTGTAGMFANAPASYGTYGPTGFNGVLDEVRIARSARSPAWLQTEYNNQHSPSSFYMVGATTAR